MNNRNKESSSHSPQEEIEYGDFEEGEAEDEAPEAVQAMSSGPGPWATFPDLLRVQSKTSATENDLPEAMGFVPVFPKSVKGASGSQAEPRGHSSGAIPKFKPLAPPDVSQTSSSSSSNQCHGARPLYALCNPPSSQMNSLQNEGLERKVRTLQTQKAILQQEILQKDVELKERMNFMMGRRYMSSTNDPQMTSLNETVAKIENALEKLQKQIGEKFNRLESRLDKLSLGTSLQGASGSDGEEGRNELLNIREELRRYNEQQKRDLENERRNFLLSFAEVFRGAAEKNSSRDEDMNGTR